MTFEHISEPVGRVVERLRSGVERIPVSDRAAWLALRRETVGASEVSAVFGKNPFITPLDLYNAKADREHDIDNAAMERGRILEPAALEAVRLDRPDWKVEKCGDLYRDLSRRIGATPDAVNAAGEPVELKCPLIQTFDDQWADEPPVHYQLQALQQAILMDAPRAWIGALIVTAHRVSLHLYEVPRHEAAERTLIDGVATFWKRIENRDPPPATYGRDQKALSSLYPRDDGTAVDLTGDNLLPDLLDRRAVLMAELRAMGKEKDAIDDEIRAKLGAAGEGTLPGWKITWKEQHRNEYTVPAKSFRVLRITDRREKEGLS